jgi:hypothetical protein
MKYIILEQSIPILFPDHVNHSDFKKLGNITSAGFVEIDIDDEKINVRVYGESVTLKLKPMSGDNILIKILLTTD